MQRQVGSVFSRSGARFFSAMVIVSILFSVLPAFSPPAAKAQEGGVATYIAEVRECPPGFDPAASDASTALANCVTPMAGVPLTLGDTRTTGGDGVVVWGELPLGAGYSVTQAIPAGYAAPWVYCEVTGGPGDNQFFFFQAPGGAMDIGLSNPALSQYAQTTCWWFNTPPGTGQVLAQEDNQTPPPVVIDIRSYLCPAGTSIDEPSRDSYAGTCVVPGAGVQITYTPAEGEPRSSPTGPDGQVIWPDLPAGSFTVQQAAIEGYDTTTVYCYVASPPEFEDIAAWEPFPVADRTISYDLLAGYELHCEFYNLPVEQNATALTVHKYLCASELFEPAASLDAYLEDCPTPHYGVTVSVRRGADVLDSKLVSYDGNGTVSFLTISPGFIDLANDSGSDLSRIFCSSRPLGETGSSGDYEETTVVIDIQAGTETECYWFTFPEEPNDTFSTITVETYECGPAFPESTANSTVQDWRDACPDPLSGVIFAAERSGIVSDVGASEVDGKVLLHVLPGEIGVYERFPEGYDSGFVWCEIRDDASNPEYVNAGMISPQEAGAPLGQEPEPHAYHCQFFNIPSGIRTAEEPPQSGSVFVDKRLCPPGFAAIGKNYVDIAMYCTAESGVEFKIAKEDSSQSAVTGPEGLATFESVPTGAIRITELPKEGYDPPAVFCRETAEGAGATGELLPVATDNWGISFEFREGYYLECVWANMPAAGTSTDPGTVVLHSYVCPVGTGEYEPLETLTAACSPLTAGVKFTSGPGIGTRAEAETDASGSAAFTNLAPGFNSTAVSEGQGYAGLSAWCDYYVSASGSAGALGRFPAQPVYAWLAPGYTSECSFFTVPYLEPVTVNIRAYVCLEENDYAGATLEQILFNCGPGAPGLRYRVSAAGNDSAQPGVEPYSVEQATTGSELVVFEEVPVGELSIAELAPYYGAVRFFCGTVEGGSSQLPASYNEPEIVNEAISFSATAPGSDVHCYVISLKLEPVNIGINAYVCLPYYEFEVAELEYLSLNCQVASGVPFTVFSSDGSSEARGSTSVAGLAVFENAPPSSLDLTEGAPDRRTVRVSCGTAASGINTLAFESDTATYLAAPGTNVVCHWFTIDTTYARVVVAKNICPEDYIPEDPTYAGALQNCPTPLPNVTFHFSEPAGEPYEAITNEEGFILLEGVNPGSIAITEAPPDDLKGALVYCREVAPGVAEPEFAPVSVEGSSINQQTVGGNLLECHWFNYDEPEPTPTPTATPTQSPTATPTSTLSASPTPGNGGNGGNGGQGGGAAGTPTPDADAPATLILTRFECPAGYDVQSAESEPGQDCDDVIDGIEFTLAEPEQDPEQKQTTNSGADGRAVFAELAPGAWVVAESLADTAVGAFVSTCQSDQREFQLDNPFVPFAYAGPEGQIGVVLVAGETLACDWYGVPRAQAKLVVTHYWCEEEVVILASCKEFDGEATVTLGLVGDPDDGNQIAVKTGEDGGALIETAGAYEIVDFDYDWCFVDSPTVDAEGRIIVGTEEVVVEIYSCGPLPVAGTE